MRAGRWVRAAACGLFFLCFALARSAALELESRDLSRVRTLTLGWELSGQDAARIAEREQQQERPVPFTMWGQREGVMAENPDLGRSTACAQISLRGDPGLLLEYNGALEADDGSGCLIDRKTARRLFGVEEPIGWTVVLGGQERIIRGMVESPQPLVVVLAAAGEARLNRLTLRVPEGEQPGVATEEFAQRNGLFGIWSQPGFWAGAARALSMLPVAALMLGVIVRYVRTAFAPEASRGRFWLGIGLAGAAWFLLLWLTEFRFQLPPEMIPNRWSDFDFWGRLFQAKRDELLGALTASKTLPELAVLLPGLRTAGLGLLGAALTPLLPRPSSGRGLWICCAAGALLAFAASVFMDPALAHDRALWLALPVGFLGRCGYGEMERILCAPPLTNTVRDAIMKKTE